MTVLSKAAAHPRIARYTGRPQVAVEVRVDDAQVQREAKGFDRMEKAFALLPNPTADGMKWERHYLDHGGVDNFTPSGAPEDYHYARLVVSEETIEAMSEVGVAFGLETNVGTLWLQERGDNTKL